MTPTTTSTATFHEASAAPEVWGVIGGMGPIASAEFLRTIYGFCDGPEQRAPVILLDSDPTFPDRTFCLEAGLHDVLARRLTHHVSRLVDLGASRVVICCMTIHAVLPLVPEHLRQRIVSLPALALQAVAEVDGPALLLCTRGTRRMRLFESQEEWPAIASRCVFPDARDQERLHRLIYAVKSNAAGARAISTPRALLRKYGATTLVAGCTELHLLARHAVAHSGPRWIDPLTILARRLVAAARDRQPVMGHLPHEAGAPSVLAERSW